MCLYCYMNDALVGFFVVLRRPPISPRTDTRFPATAIFRSRRGEASIGATLHKRIDLRRWQAFVRNAKRLRVGETVDFGAGASVLQSPFAASTGDRSEEHTSELQSLMRISYAVFCLKKKKLHYITNIRHVSNAQPH